MYEEYFNFIYLGFIVFAGLVGFKIIFSYKLAKYKAVEQKARRQEKEEPNDEMEAYIKHPEETLKTLMAQREVFVKEKDVGKMGAIDAQIKGLELLCKIPAPIRPAAMRIMKKGLKSIEGLSDGF